MMRTSESGGDAQKRECSMKNSNFLSIITFWFTLKIFHRGRKKDFTEQDLTKPLDSHNSILLGETISKNWSREYDDAVRKKRKPSMAKVLVKTFYKEIVLYGIALVIMELIIRLTQPLFIGLFIRYFGETNRNMNGTSSSGDHTYFVRVFYFYEHTSNRITAGEAYFFAGGIAFCSLFYVMTFHPYMFAVLHVGMRMRVACCSLIYRKALRIRLTSLGGNTVGNAVNLMSNDVARFDLAPIFVHYIWISPIQTVLITWLMFQEMGVSAIIGILAIAVVMPIQIVMGLRTANLRMKSGQRTDDRIRQMNEIIQSMQVIKMYAWENAFSALINKLRKKELKILIQTSFIRGLIMSFIMFTSRFAIFLTVMYYVNDGHITAEKVFVISGYYQILRQTMTVYFPQGLAMVAEASVSIKRIQKFMLIEETNVGDPSPLDPLWEHKPNKYAKRVVFEAAEAPYVQIKRGIAKYGDSVCLDNVNVEMLPGTLTTIVGSVGAGKTCLLNLVLGELALFSGKLTIRGTVSYASQSPWLFAGSVRQNILFGREFLLDRYRAVVKACALTRDFSLLPFGDRTIVGERGASMSGGQRARVNLARAVYKEADIYLLDDPLSAVDILVGQQLFDGCLKKFLGDKIVILVTHQLQYLKRADQIVVIDEGVIQGVGNYAQLMISDADFSTLMKGQITVTGEEKEVEKAVRALSISSAAFNSMIDIEGRKKGPIVLAEMRTEGKVAFANYKLYFLAGGNCCCILVMIFLFLFAQILASGGDYFLSQWVNLEEVYYEEEIASSSVFGALNRNQCIAIYTTVIVTTVIVAIVRSLMFFSICMRSSMMLHRRMFNSVIQAAMAFFYANTSGRILNRFSKDLGAVDELLPNAFIDTTQILLNLFGAIVVVAFVEPLLLIPTVVMFIVFIILRHIYLKTSTNVKRLEGITRSPVFAHLNATVQGLTTIRSNGAERQLVTEFDQLQNMHSSAWFMFLATSRAFSYWLDLICFLYITVVTFYFVLMSAHYYGSAVGLAITQCLGLSGLVQWGMRQSAELENQMTSVERVLEFTKIEHEPDLESSPENKPPVTWPRQGLIEFIDTSMRYSPFDPPVLKHLDLIIYPREKIGIVGRTGAGKSTLISTLYRLGYYEGQILIDNIDIGVLGLHDLRRKISIIPQEPVIFSGTLRYNLDPFNEYKDEKIFDALLAVELRNAMENGIDCLDDVMSQGGENLSVGTRQLVCLARAILRKNLILVMDEATANMDSQTDQFIQKTIRTKFSDCTVLTIAHRLHTIMDSDRVLVMDAGQLAEFDHPHILLQNKDGIFFDLVKKTGPGVSEQLKRMAKQFYDMKHAESTKESTTTNQT